MEMAMLRENAKKLGGTGSEAAVLEQKDSWAVELRDVIVRIVKTATAEGREQHSYERL
jgi:hypothetical protein